MRKIKTISVPPELEAELGKFEENWSAVACRAFEIRLKELEAMNITDTTERAIVRLRASKMRATEETYSDGAKAGVWYVTEHAEFLELERLEKWKNILQNWPAICETISLKAICRAMNQDCMESVADLIRNYGGSNVDQPRWLEGFVDGALSKFGEIKSRI